MRRLLGAVALAFLVCSGVVAPPAAAQETAVTLQLVSQTPVVQQYHRGTLDLELLAINGGATTLKNLTLTVSFGPRIVTSADFEPVLTGEFTSIAHEDKELHFDIAPGKPQQIAMRVHVERLAGIEQTDSQVYPTRIDLSSEEVVLASLSTSMIYLVERPPQPLLLSTWMQLAAPIAFAPDGTLIDPAFPTSIAEGGSIRAALDAVAKATGGRNPDGVLDLVLDPLLITQARDLEDGYTSSDGTVVAPPDQTTTEAAKFIRILGRATANGRTLETIAQPYGDPILPAMLDSGLGDELTAERDAANAAVKTLQPEAPGRTTDAVVRPRDGRLSDETLDSLAGKIVLADADTVDRAPFQDAFASAPAPTVPTASGATMVLPDPSVQALFDQADLFTDPVRGAQIVLGELAAIWKQLPSPGPPTRRGVAIAPPSALPPGVWLPLLEGIGGAPFLKPVTVSALVDHVHPTNPNVNPTDPNDFAPLNAPDDSSFEPDYASRITTLEGSVDALGSMLPADDLTARDLRRQLFIATAPPYQFDPTAGSAWLDAAEAATGRAFAAATPTGSRQFTFTSTEGKIPVQFGDPGPTPLNITVELQSTSFTFPSGNQKAVTLDHGGVVVEFPVIAQTSGLSQIDVVVRAPDGREIDRTRIDVRSTAVNHIALLVTAGAAAVLVALYMRRWVRRRRTAVS